MTSLHTAAKQDIPDLIAGALGVSRGTAYDLMREALAEQPAQHEPFTHYRHYDNGLQDWADEKTIPLYTSPPAQRKPLTNEEITKAFNEAMAKRPKDASNAETNRLFVRAIEAALGIGEKK